MSSLLSRAMRAFALGAVGLFFLFPFAWLLRASFVADTGMLDHYAALIAGPSKAYLGHLFDSLVLSTLSVLLSLLLGVPAAYAFARLRSPLSDGIAFALLSARLVPPLVLLLPLQMPWQALGLHDTHAGMVLAYQFITLPPIVWIARGCFEDLGPHIEQAFRLDGHGALATFAKLALPLAWPGIAAAAALAFILAWNDVLFPLILGADAVQPVTVGALALVGAGDRQGQAAAALVLGVLPTAAIALLARRPLVEHLRLGATRR